MDGATARRYMAELIGTGLLVFFGAGMATIVFGFRASAAASPRAFCSPDWCSA